MIKQYSKILIPKKLNLQKINIFNSINFDNTVYLFRNIDKSLNSTFNQMRKSSFSHNMGEYSYYSRVNLIGLGYKNFVVNNQLYILVGDSNYIIYDIPENLNIMCKKNQIYMTSVSKDLIFDFAEIVKKTKKMNIYKGKGLVFFKNFKFMKLKVGKKQKY